MNAVLSAFTTLPAEHPKALTLAGTSGFRQEEKVRICGVIVDRIVGRANLKAPISRTSVSRCLTMPHGV